MKKFDVVFLTSAVIMFAAHKSIATSALLAMAGIWNIITAAKAIREDLHG